MRQITPGGPYHVRDAESLEAYIERQRRAGQPYDAPCPSCPERRRRTGSKLSGTVLVYRAGSLHRIDNEGYVTGEVCGFCQAWQDKAKYIKAGRDRRRTASEEDERRARVEQAEAAERRTATERKPSPWVGQGDGDAWWDR